MKNYTQILPQACKEIGLKVNADKTKYINMTQTKISSKIIV